MINDILKYWTLCELSDFKSFRMPDVNIKEYTYALNIDKSAFHNEDSIVSKFADTEYQNKTYPDSIKRINGYKKTTIYKLYLGLIKVEDFIKFLYEKTSPHLVKNYENELERINTDEYTYLGYVYLDYLGNIISIENKSIDINPIFYILKNIKNQSMLNNFNYGSFMEEFNDEFCERYSITKNSLNIIVPSFYYLMKSMNPRPNGNPFKFLEYKESKILIFSELYEHLKNLASDTLSEYYDKALIYYDYLKKIKDKDVTSNYISIIKSSEKKKEVHIDQYILDETIKFSLWNSSSIIYYLTNKYNQLDGNAKLPINMYIYEFFNKENLIDINFKIKKGKIKIDFHDIQEMVLESFNIPKELLCANSSNDAVSFFIGIEHKDLLFDFLRNAVESQAISFYIDALCEEPRKLTIDYIKGKTKRIDVNDSNKSNENRKKINDLKYFKSTPGKWASKYPLYYAQQAAVNLFLSNYNKEGNIFSVNGPPGTGKTTLLKDVIANIIIKRTQNILDLDGSIFSDNALHDNFVGKYEIIVTSNNNSAVENISIDLPKIDEFDFEYLGCNKDALLLSDFANEFYGYECWNLFSIRLGKKANVDEFKTNFDNIVNKIKEVDNLTNESYLNSRLKELKKEFNNIKKSLKADEKEFNSFNELPKLSESIKARTVDMNQLKNQIDVIESEIEQIETKNDEKEAEQNKLEKKEKILTERRGLKKENLDSFGFFAKYIFKRKAFKSLQDEIYELNNDHGEILKRKCIITDEIYEIKQLKSSKEETLEVMRDNLFFLNKKNEDEQTKYDALHEIFRNKEYYIPDDEYFNFSEEKVQRDKQLYGKESYLKNKSLLFLVSLQISEVIFLKNIDKFSNSINEYLEQYRRNDLIDNDLKKLQNNFAALFFVFPLVSTTLASSYNMLKNIESYGALICDESGQATPQSLVGALNRANNALIVGDPLQVEPVFTVPELVINIYNDAFKIPPEFSPTTSSAQQLADNANPFGSYYLVQDKRVWVGMPLVVHRRCLEPMFTIANEISYNGKMVSATTYNDELIEQLPESCWIDVVSSEDDYELNSSKKEIAAMQEFIKRHNHLLQGNYYIISPFKSINRVLESKKDNTEKIFGTVHTFQGKEADVVFIVLGGKKDGSKSWAAQKANILNVALTRAKKKVYIVGDYEKWKKLNYFNTATSILQKSEMF
jgi:hypothetical protein